MHFEIGTIALFASVLLVGCASLEQPASHERSANEETVQVPKQWTRSDTTPEQIRQDRARCGLQTYEEAETVSDTKLVFVLCMEAKGYRPVYEDQTSEPPAVDVPAPCYRLSGQCKSGETGEPPADDTPAPTAAAPTSTGGAEVDCTKAVSIIRYFLVERAQGVTAEEQIASFPPDQRAYAGKLIRAAYRIDSAIVTNPERRGAYLMRTYDRCVDQDWKFPP